MIIPRAPSGIPGLDAVIQGGIPTNTTIALRAEPSNATECVQQQFIAEGLKVANVINSMKNQGFDVLESIANDQLVLLDCYSLHKRTSGMGVDPAIQKKIVSVTEVDDERMLQDGLSTAVERISDLKGLRAVCESVPGTLTSKNSIDLMRWGRKAFADLRAFDTLAMHTFPIGIREELFLLMAHDFDAIFEIKVERNADRVKYYLSIPKLRLTSVPQRMFELDTENQILSITTHQKIT
jgi:hypothetical protein